MKTAYPLFTISILLILFYTLSVTLLRTGLLSRPNHRKFWNVLLLLTFLVTGFIGLVMVLKINYKLEIPYYEDFLAYHVDFGIGMVIIGFVHFWWHIEYYFNLLKGEKSQEIRTNLTFENDLSLFALKIAAFMLGSTSMITQIILMREFLSVFNGNELVVGLVLANWMVLTGIGAFIGKRRLNARKVSKVIFTALLLLSVIPFIITFLINFLKNKVFPLGAMIDVFQMFLASLVLLIPFCLLSGLLFTFITRCYSELRKENETSIVYGLESMGSIAGGLLSGLIFIFILSSVESLLVLIVMNGLILIYLRINNEVQKLPYLTLMVAVTAFVMLFFKPESKIRKWVYPNQDIVISKDSPYGNIVITRRENMWSVYNNNILLFDSENFMIDEETVHFAMVQHPGPSNVLLISGGLSGQITELKKYEPLSIDYVEDNQWLLALMKDSLTKIGTNQFNLSTTDPIRFLRKTEKKYDVAILNLPVPSTLQANRFYTLEFFSLLKKKLTPGAILSFGLPAPANYMNDESVELNSTNYATLKKVFQNVIIIPGEKNYFLASDGQLNYNISMKVKEKGIKNRYVNENYFNDLLLKSRGEKILSYLNPVSKTNQNLKPVLYGQELAYWLSYLKGKYYWLLGLASILSIIVLSIGNMPSKVMFLCGFSATGMEMLLLLGLQIYFGNIYLLTSFVFTGFMLGLSVGSFLGKSLNSLSDGEYLSYNQLLIGIFTLICGLLLFSSFMTNLFPALVYTLFLTATIVIGGLTGFQFSKASLIQRGTYSEISGLTYSYDLFGSALGALVMTIYLVPGFGIIASAIFLSILNLIAGILLTLRKR